MRWYQQERYDRLYAGEARWGITPGVLWLIVINLAIYLAEVILLRTDAGRFEEWIGWFWLDPVQVFEQGRVWQLVTHAFLHDWGDPTHVVFNMLFLYFFGRDVEARLGRAGFLLFYLGAAVFAGGCYCAWHYAIGEAAPCVGASGAVFAVEMAFALWWPNVIIIFFFIPMRVIVAVGIAVVIESFSLLVGGGDVANMAHLGGLLYGFVFVRWFPWQRIRLPSSLERLTVAAERRQARRERDDRRLDAILAKVQRDGLNSLNWFQRRFLKKMSTKKR